VTQIVENLKRDQSESASKLNTERSRLEARLSKVRQRMDKAYEDKVDGKISEDFWKRTMEDWRTEEQQVQVSLDCLEDAETGDRALDAERILELAQKAYFSVC
jgi:hypothetical protein